MIAEKDFDRLTANDLLALQKHLKLGPEHAKKHLSEREIGELYSLSRIGRTTASEIDVDKAELAGVSTLGINAILTASFGAWMGVSGFMGLKLNSKWLFYSVLSWASLFGTAIGSLNYRFTKKAAQNAVEKRILQEIELYLLNKVIHLRQEEIQRKAQEIHQLAQSIRNPDSPAIPYCAFASPEECEKWAGAFKETIAKAKPSIPPDLFEKEVVPAQKKIEESLQSSEQKSARDIPPPIEKLLRHELAARNAKQPWFKANFKNLFVGLLPTLFGGFSSLFVYLNGAPNLAKEWNRPDLYYFLTNPKMKILQFAAAVSVTLYFALSFIHMNRKAFKRNQELQKTDLSINYKEDALSLLDDRLLRAKEVLSQLKTISLICKLIKAG